MHIAQTDSKVYIIILNYKGWQDTIACVESLFKQSYSNYHIIIVDNYSPDDSVDRIQHWANGKLRAEIDETQLAYLIEPFSKKPVDYKIFHEDDDKLYHKHSTDCKSLTIIRAISNRGFSAGNNIGLKFAIAQNDAFCFWLLNNDTIVTPATLTALVDCYKSQSKSRKIGIIGGKLLYYHQPDTIQCLGGATYNPYSGLIKQQGNGLLDKPEQNQDNWVIDYVAGACMLVIPEFVREVGLLAEDYFLYYEEIDWCTRGKKAGWTITYTSKAIVYHKEGASSGASNRFKAKKSEMADFLYVKNKLLYTYKYEGILANSLIKISLLGTILNRVLRGQYNRIPMILKLLFKQGG